MPKDCIIHYENDYCGRTGGRCIGEEYCTYPADSKIETCDICGNKLLKEEAVYEDGKIICRGCSNRSSSCYRCVHGAECSFQTDPSPLPLQIQQTIRQGNVIMQTLVKNPERIRQTCQNGCPCWSEEFECCKENYQTCGNYKDVT